MAPAHSICFANNKGGAGKTFMAFQLACEAARSRPDKKVLVFDFSLYSDITALLLGGSAREGFGAPMKGLQVTVDNTTADTRAEGLVRDLECAMEAAPGAAAAPQRPSIFGAFFRAARPAAAAPTAVDLTKYMLRPADFNPAIPGNLHLVPSAGMESWSPQNTSMGAAEDEPPLWARKGDDWWPAAQRLKEAIEALPSEFDAVFVDTDHLAACVLTKLALAAVRSVVVPLSDDDGDFNRLFQDVTGNALFTDVMAEMDGKGQLSARVDKMVFTSVDKTKNAPATTPSGIASPFTPSKTAMAQMDDMAAQTWSACAHDDRYRRLFRGAAELEPRGANISRTFAAAFFGTFKLVPDLAAALTKMNGIPVCAMTGESYTAANGLSGKSDKGALDALKQEMQALVQQLLGAEYHKAPLAS